MIRRISDKGEDKMEQVMVIGGGASGIVASIVAARKGIKVTLIERQARIGKKILVTGNGRCNITNTSITSNAYHTNNKKDYMKPLEMITTKMVLEFFETLGIIPLYEGNKVYPLSEQASSVVDVLRMELERLGVTILTEEKVIKLKQKKGKWRIYTEKENMYLSDAVIVATGGMAAPQLGCDATGYHILEQLGHYVYPAFPTLVHMKSSTRACKMLQGTKLKAKASIYVQNEWKRTEQGEVLFTEDGLSGPPIFQLSRIASDAFLNQMSCSVKLDLFPDRTKEELVSLIYTRIANAPKRTIEQLFIGWLHKRAIVPILKTAGVTNIHLLSEQIEYTEVQSIVDTLKAWKFEIKGTRDYRYAQATAGGISLEEIHLETMESRIAKGLYITGEILDVDGDCGGYNLQWAWATGMLAGDSISQ